MPKKGPDSGFWRRYGLRLEKTSTRREESVVISRQSIASPPASDRLGWSG